MNERSEPIVANLLTGFLGAGKTSLLNRLLSRPALADTAVLINEFGSVGLDHLLVESVDDDIVLLKSGCICCTIRTDLKAAILSLFDRMRRGEIRRFSRLVIETTGLADPAPILATLSVDPMLKFHFRLGNVITVVDVPNGIHNIESFPESARQVAVADRIVISKADLAGPRELQALQDRLARMNPAAETVVLDETSYPAETLLLDTIHDLGARPAEVARWIAAEALEGEGHGHDHDVNQHGNIRALVIEADEPISWPRFALWLSMLIHRHGREILRLKGLIAIEGAETPVVIQGVQHLIHKPVHLDAWPDAARRTRIVIIGSGLDRELMQRSFDAFNLKRQPALSA
ncbi:MAG TPA: GTP-binding protein [Devosiaceae bacterium]|nr:GTP-binding protein [Devosiaceae bacterium]